MGIAGIERLPAPSDTSEVQRRKGRYEKKTSNLSGCRRWVIEKWNVLLGELPWMTYGSWNLHT